MSKKHTEVLFFNKFALQKKIIRNQSIAERFN